jgi:hypothetical protein
MKFYLTKREGPGLANVANRMAQKMRRNEAGI